MDNIIIKKILQAQKQRQKPFNISAVGISMNPVIYEGDKLTVLAQPSYKIGDILVFYYKQGELLVHRLLRIHQDRFYCKGDNAFRLEDVDKNQIVGKVIAINDMPVQSVNTKFIEDSYKVNREFRKCGYNSEKAKQSEVYKNYKEKYLTKGETI